ncbi:MAG: DUF4350 domain-containing protein [Longimicrobiales bacterium]
MDDLTWWHRWLSLASCMTLIAGLAATPVAVDAQQVPDRGFVPPIGSATFARGEGPEVGIDAAHVNFHTMEGRYQSFARLLTRDGYQVRSNSSPFTASSLETLEVLVIANAMHSQSEDDFAPLPNLSAFTDAEIGEVERWVAAGGSLLLIADHMPIAGHAEDLAAAFGIRFHNGFVFDADGNGLITFRRSDGTLVESAVIDGRDGSERVDSVTAFTGQAFRVDPDVDATPLLVVPEGYSVVLPSVAWEFSESTPRVPAAYLLQGALVRHGQGRVAVFGEAAMFSAQLAGPEERPMGMNHPAAAQNYRFALNIMRWLSQGTR